jgi:uncharacterized membrane protein
MKRTAVPPSQTNYDILDVPANAPAERIKESYHVFASIWHPDRFAQGSKQHQLATRKLRELNAAYEVLRDPARRAAYDRRLIEERRVSGVYWTLRAQGQYGPPTGSTNRAAMLAYACGLVTGITVLLVPAYRRDRFVRFHAWQSVLLSIITYLGIVLGPLVGLHRPIYWLLWMTGFAVCSIFLMKRAYYNEPYQLPVLGALAVRSAGLEPQPEPDASAETAESREHVF